MYVVMKVCEYLIGSCTTRVQRRVILSQQHFPFNSSFGKAPAVRDAVFTIWLPLRIVDAPQSVLIVL